VDGASNVVAPADEAPDVIDVEAEPDPTDPESEGAAAEPVRMPDDPGVDPVQQQPERRFRLF
jgi:hypothetical protein